MYSCSGKGKACEVQKAVFRVKGGGSRFAARMKNMEKRNLPQWP